MPPESEERGFRMRLRVRYHECDGQKVVFHARYAEYIDVATQEFTRVLFGGVDAEHGGLDWRLVSQSIQWKAPARFDDILEVLVKTVRVGTTSFALSTLISKLDGTLLSSAETIYVAFNDVRGEKMVLTPEIRQRLSTSAIGHMVDCSGATSCSS